MELNSYIDHTNLKATATVEDIKKLCEEAKKYHFASVDAIDGHTLKVIIETCYLEKDEIIKMTEICNETFVNFIKTSTGFGTCGATVEAVEIMNKHKNNVLEIKASGGIRDIETVEAMIKAGATRLGTSSGVVLMQVESTCECSNHEEGHECHCHDGKCDCHE